MTALSSTLTMSGTPAVQLSHITRLFGSFVALRDISLELPAGSSVMLLGPNGAGKSTLLRVIAGLATPTYGAVRVFGQTLDKLRGQVAYMGHSTMLYDELTGPENLSYMLQLERPALPRLERDRQVAAALTAVDLQPSNPRRLGEYSQGMRQRAALARVLLTEPDLLLLDEPFSNLDTRSAAAMIARLTAYLADRSPANVQRTLIFTTHQAELARPLARQTFTMVEGSLATSVPRADTPATASAASLSR